MPAWEECTANKLAFYELPARSNAMLLSRDLYLGSGAESGRGVDLNPTRVFEKEKKQPGRASSYLRCIIPHPLHIYRQNFRSGSSKVWLLGQVKWQHLKIFRIIPVKIASLYLYDITSRKYCKTYQLKKLHPIDLMLISHNSPNEYFKLWYRYLRNRWPRVWYDFPCVGHSWGNGT